MEKFIQTIIKQFCKFCIAARVIVMVANSFIAPTIPTNHHRSSIDLMRNNF